MVGDDLKVMPVSMGEGLEMMRRLGVEDGSEVEKRIVEVGSEEILMLLKRSLVSETPLTDVFLREPDNIDFVEKLVGTSIAQARGKHNRTTRDPKRINVKLYLSTESNRVVCAESGKEFVDLLFSFLTFPLGAILKLLNMHAFIGCIDNLYKSVELLSSGCGYMKSEESKDMLLAPKLAPHFSCSSQLLDIGEVFRQKIRTSACRTCEAPVTADRCFHGMQYGVYDEINPKRQNSDLEQEEGYVKGLVKFMVTDELEVTPLSPISGVNIIQKLMLPVNCLEETEASLGETEALDLLQACLISRTPLSDIFSPCLLTLLQENWFGKLPSKTSDMKKM
ncbi:uncharacterized protein M6B38_399500 [Iris pallida]|nr:uncharacterized protein M6B38_399500 [Iris pallida]